MSPLGGIIMKSFYAQLVSIATCLIASNVVADEWKVGLGFGFGDASIDGPIFSDGDSLSDTEVASNELSLGLYLADDMYLNLSYIATSNISFGVSDRVRYRSARLGIGKEWHTQNRWVFHGELGAAIWELDAKEATFLNPGLEEDIEIDGVDLYARVGGGYKFGERFVLGLAADYDRSDRVDVNSVRLFGYYRF